MSHDTAHRLFARANRSVLHTPFACAVRDGCASLEDVATVFYALATVQRTFGLQASTDRWRALGRGLTPAARAWAARLTTVDADAHAAVLRAVLVHQGPRWRQHTVRRFGLERGLELLDPTTLPMKPLVGTVVLAEAAIAGAFLCEVLTEACTSPVPEGALA